METSGSDRKRQRREAQSNEELDVSAVQSLAAARADPPGQLGNTREATLDSSVPAQLLTANPVPSSSREQAPLISSNTDTQRALARLRAVQPQLRTQLLSAADTTSSIQELMRYRLVKQHQSPPQQHTNIYQQALNGVPVLEDPHQQQRRQASERDILLRLKQESEQLPPVDHMLLHQNTALRPSHPMLGMFMQSRAHQQTNPLLQAQMMQLQGYANQPQRIPQVPLNALSLPLSSVVSRHPTLPGHLVPGLCVPMQNPRASMVDPRLLGSIAGEARGAAVSATVPAVVPVTMPKESGRGSVLMAMSTDKESLSSYQCLIREQIEIFEAKAIDVDCGAQGRNKPIVLGQVGLRCIHCKHVPLKQRARASTYYPAKLSGMQSLYQCILAYWWCCQLLSIHLSITNLIAFFFLIHIFIYRFVSVRPKYYQRSSMCSLLRGSRRHSQRYAAIASPKKPARRREKILGGDGAKTMRVRRLSRAAVSPSPVPTANRRGAAHVRLVQSYRVSGNRTCCGI